MVDDWKRIANTEKSRKGNELKTHVVLELKKKNNEREPTTHAYIVHTTTTIEFLCSFCCSRKTDK